MEDSHIKLYYIISGILSVCIAISLFSLLNWPVFAKGPLSVCIGIEVFYVSRQFYKSFEKNTHFSIKELIYELKNSIYNTDAL